MISDFLNSFIRFRTHYSFQRDFFIHSATNKHSYSVFSHLLYRHPSLYILLNSRFTSFKNQKTWTPLKVKESLERC
jgi:hypothetical protein